jgi:ketosteroid isomerase-like protein
MKKSLLQFITITSLTLLLCVTFSCQKQDTVADIAAINEIWNQYTLAINSADYELWISLWEDNGVQMPPDAPAVFGKEQIRVVNESKFEPFNVNAAIKNDEVLIDGGLAFSRGTYTAALTPKAGGETINIIGKYLTIFKKQIDGSWKIYCDCFNSAVPPKQE